jgi:hypothetical protein
MHKINKINRPKILAINPWIYDFTAYNLWARPIGLLRFLRLLQLNNVEFTYIDFMDPSSIYPPGSEIFSEIKYKKNGTSSYPKTEIEKPPEFSKIKRKYYRFGIPQEILGEYLEEIKPEIVIIGSEMVIFPIFQVRHTVYFKFVVPVAYYLHFVSAGGVPSVYAGFHILIVSVKIVSYRSIAIYYGIVRAYYSVIIG